jgi:hypothetical protein
MKKPPMGVLSIFASFHFQWYGGVAYAATWETPTGRADRGDLDEIADGDGYEYSAVLVGDF